MTLLLQARALEAWHGRRRVLAPCDSHITRGEIFGLYGPNGAGKSTLLQTLAHPASACSGRARPRRQIVGRDLSVREFRRRSAMVFQDCLLLRGTVLDNVALVSSCAVSMRSSANAARDFCESEDEHPPEDIKCAQEFYLEPPYKDSNTRAPHRRVIIQP